MRSVLIADDHEVTRRGIREILRDAFADVEVAEATDGSSLLALVEQRKWDLILLDIIMPETDVIDVLGQIRKVDNDVPVLILTAVTEGEYVAQTMRGGANGFINKHRASDDLLEAIEKVSRGGTYIDPETAAAFATAIRDSERPLLHEKLSDRELEIFRLIAVGRAIKEIGGDLGISEKTVATYVGRIREKTGLTSYVDIARYALRNGLVD